MRKEKEVQQWCEEGGGKHKGRIKHWRAEQMPTIQHHSTNLCLSCSAYETPSDDCCDPLLLAADQTAAAARAFPISAPSYSRSALTWFMTNPFRRGGDAQELTNTWKAFESTFLPSVVSPCVHAKTQPEAGGTVKACHWAVWSQVCAFGSAPSVQSWNQLRVECGGEWGRCHLPSISQQRSSLSGAEMEAWMAAISRLETPFCKTLCVLFVWTQRGHRKLQWEPFEHFLPKPADS